MYMFGAIEKSLLKNEEFTHVRLGVRASN